MAVGLATIATLVVLSSGAQPWPSPQSAAERVPPPSPVVEGPAAATAETGARLVFSDDDQQARFRCGLDDDLPRWCTSPVEYSALDEGAHTFRVWAIGAGGERSLESVHTWVIDLARPPRPVLESRPGVLTNDDRARFAFSEPEEGLRLECRLDDEAPGPCTSPADLGPLADGDHRFTVTATDPAGNRSAPAEVAWVVDTTAPPAPAILEAPAPASPSAAAQLAFAGAEGALSFGCALDGATARCESPAAFGDLADGPHRFAVTATDLAGNESTAASYDWTVDTQPPRAPDIVGHPDATTPRAGAVFSLAPGEDASLLCRLDGGPVLACPRDPTYGPLAPGTHRLTVRAHDAAGNRSGPAEFAWRFDPDLYRSTVLGHDGLLGYWRLGETTWGPAADERGAGHPGAYSGGVTLGAAGAIRDDPDRAAAFDGLSGEALLLRRVPETFRPPELSRTGTLEGWFDWRSGVAALRDNTDANGWILGLESNRRLAGRAGGLPVNSTLDIAAVRGGWHQLVLTKARTPADRPLVSLYVDGELVRSQEFATEGASSVAPWHVMNNGAVSDQYSEGRADDVAIYDVALTAGEVREHYRLGRAP
jgi:hypothetical protein